MRQILFCVVLVLLCTVAIVPLLAYTDPYP